MGGGNKFSVCICITKKEKIQKNKNVKPFSKVQIRYIFVNFSLNFGIKCEQYKSETDDGKKKKKEFSILWSVILFYTLIIYEH